MSAVHAPLSLYKFALGPLRARVGACVRFFGSLDRGARVGTTDGTRVGVRVGLFDCLESFPGVGTTDGTTVGTTVGTYGTSDGADVGVSVAVLVGVTVGIDVIATVGAAVGASSVSYIHSHKYICVSWRIDRQYHHNKHKYLSNFFVTIYSDVYVTQCIYCYIEWTAKCSTGSRSAVTTTAISTSAYDTRRVDLCM